MVVLDFSYEDLKKYIDIDKDEAIELISMIGAPTEIENNKLYVELTPDRPDMYSLIGVVRAIKAFKNKKTTKYCVKTGEYEVNASSEFRPYTVCAVVKSLTLDDQKIRDLVILQEKLISTLGRKAKKFGIGLYPLDKIEFPLYYKTIPKKDIKYRPLGWEKKATAEEILEKHKKGKEFGYILQNREELPVYLDKKGEILALLPIVNSEETGKVTVDTQDIFVEVSGESLHLCEKALNIMVCALADLGGEIFSVKVNSERYPKLERKKIEIDEEFAEKILGEKLDFGLLEKMDYIVKEDGVYAPPYRADILGKIDVIEDLAIAYDYNNFSPTLPNFYTIGRTKNDFYLEHQILRAMGFVEVNTFVLVDNEYLEFLGFEDYISVKNPKTKECSALRPSIIPSLIKVIQTNKMKQLPQFIYEIGQVSEGEYRLAFASVGLKEFSDFRGYLQTLMRELDKEFTLEQSEMKIFTEVCAKIIIGNRENGIIGKLSKELEEKYGIQDVYIAEIKIQ